jgi:hypothetical protein
VNGGQQPSSILWAAEQMSGFFQFFVVVERHHYDGLIAIPSDGHGIAIPANLVHRRGQAFPSRRVGDGFHLYRIMSIR